MYSKYAIIKMQICRDNIVNIAYKICITNLYCKIFVTENKTYTHFIFLCYKFFGLRISNGWFWPLLF